MGGGNIILLSLGHQILVKIKCFIKKKAYKNLAVFYSSRLPALLGYSIVKQELHMGRDTVYDKMILNNLRLNRIKTAILNYACISFNV